MKERLGTRIVSKFDERERQYFASGFTIGPDLNNFFTKAKLGGVGGDRHSDVTESDIPILERERERASPYAIGLITPLLT